MYAGSANIITERVIMQQVYRSAVVGLGRMGYNFGLQGFPFTYDHCSNFRAHPRTKLISVCDIETQKASAVSKALDVEGFTSLDAMLTSSKPEIIAIAVQPEHQEEVFHIVEQHPCVMAVFCEKPWVITSWPKHLPIQVHFLRRFDLLHQQIKQAIEQEELGTIKSLRCMYSGGVLQNGCHFFDLARWWGIPMEKVQFVETDDFEGRCTEVELQGTKYRVRLLEGGFSPSVEGPAASKWYRDLQTWQRYDRAYKTDILTMTESWPSIRFMENALANLLDHLDNPSVPLICPASEAHQTLRTAWDISQERNLKW